MVKAVIFDFWGTLAENGTYSPLRQTFSTLRVRMPFSKFVQTFAETVMTRDFEDQADLFTEACYALNVEPKPFIIDKLIGVWNKNKLMAELYPETIDVLKSLKEKGIKIILVSNATQDSVESVIERFELNNFFDHVLLSNKEGKLKNTGLFDLALTKAKLKAEDVISVGDSIETDIKGAEASGIKSYLVDRKGRREFERKISSLSELLDLLEE